MKITDFLKNYGFGIAICKGKQELFDMPNQRATKSFWGIMLVTTDKHHPAASFPQQPMLREK